MSKAWALVQWGSLGYSEKQSSKAAQRLNKQLSPCSFPAQQQAVWDSRHGHGHVLSDRGQRACRYRNKASVAGSNFSAPSCMAFRKGSSSMDLWGRFFSWVDCIHQPVSHKLVTLSRQSVVFPGWLQGFTTGHTAVLPGLIPAELSSAPTSLAPACMHA